MGLDKELSANLGGVKFVASGTGAEYRPLPWRLYWNKPFFYSNHHSMGAVGGVQFNLDVFNMKSSATFADAQNFGNFPRTFAILQPL